MENIQYLLHKQIDIAKWDTCINHARNGLIYATSHYLNSMATQWDALVLNDYEMVMPLPRRKKLGFSYLFQPSITPALGIFGNGITAAVTHQFINAIPAAFKLWDVSFNSGNTITANTGTTITRNNFVLELDKSYDILQQHYSENIRRNIAKAIKNNCMVSTDISFTDVAAICKKEFPKFTTVENGLFDKLENVYQHFKNDAVAYGVCSKEGNLLASAIFLFYNRRAYYWLVGNTPESKQQGASSLLVDSFIKDHAAKKLLLDFEGSDTPSVAEFYKRFGAELEPYHTLYLNKLPFPLKFLKPLPAYYKALI